MGVISARKLSGVAVAVGVTAATSLLTHGLAANGVAAQPATVDEMGSIVEDFSYPGADAVTEIKLIRGDGNIMMVACPSGGFDGVQVRRNTIEPGISSVYCFSIRGSAGWLELEIPDAILIRGGNDYDVEAILTVGGVAQGPIHIGRADWQPVGVGVEDGDPAALVQIRAKA